MKDIGRRLIEKYQEKKKKREREKDTREYPLSGKVGRAQLKDTEGYLGLG